MKIPKYFPKIFIIFFALATLATTFVYASDLTSSSFIIRDPIIGTMGDHGTSASFELFSAGNPLFSGAASSASFKTYYGFLYFPSATTTATISFDIDTATTDTETATPYSVPLGTLTTSAVTRSNGSVNSIWTDLDTNAASGAVITVLSTSLKSTSVPGDTIPSITTTMSAGTANYGLCVAATSATTGTLNEVSPYDGSPCVDGAVNLVGIIDGTARSILDSNSAAIAGGRGQIRVNAAISNVTPAHNDYADTLTFIATGTF